MQGEFDPSDDFSDDEEAKNLNKDELHKAENDACSSDFYGVSSEDIKAWSRPSIFIVIDQCSKMSVGIQLNYQSSKGEQ